MDKEVFLKVYKLIFILIGGFMIFLLGCANQRMYNKRLKVYVEEKEGKYTLIRNGKPFSIKGASGFTYLKELNEIGGNTIRTYDTAEIGSILDEAEANHLAVVIGLPIADNKLFDGFYDNPVKAEGQFNAYKKLIEEYKNHPAVLMWCLGNELDFKLHFNSWNFYRAYNNLVKMIQTTDPDHPVTTTVTDVSRNNIVNIKLCTSVDLISVNSFGGLKDLRKELKEFSWFWKSPYLILEWGIKGPWWPNEEKTSWESYIEGTSSKKAQQYLQTYQQQLPVEDPRLLGSFVFYWGQKQEYTPTWYSMFSEDGSASEVVGVMRYIWTHKFPEHPAPRINYMLIDEKGSRDNLLYKPGKVANAELRIDSLYKTITHVKWELCHEDWYKEDYSENQKKPISIDSLFISRQNFKATFSTPLQEGPYRLFATLFDRFGNFATCNTPFYVVK